MPNTKITKQKWKDHLSYSKRTYIFGVIISVAVASLIFSITRYQVPNEKAVQIALVDSYVATDKLDDVVPVLLKNAQAEDDELEQVQFLSIAYSGNSDTASEEDYYGSQVYMVQVYAGDNDIYLQNERLTQSMIDQNYILPLENFEGFDEFIKKHPNVSVLWQSEPTGEDESDDGEEEPEPQENAEEPVLHAYALDASSLMGMVERSAYSVYGKYACLVYASKNPETSFKVLCDMYDVLTSSESAE